MPMRWWSCREKHGVKIERTPPDILAKMLESWDQIAKEEVAKNPFFKKVYDSQREFASKVVPARRDVYAPYELAPTTTGRRRNRTRGDSRRSDLSV